MSEKNVNFDDTFKMLVKEIEECGQIAQSYYDSGDTTNELKLDKSVVTKIDREVEARLTTFIKRYFPGDEIVGEEYGRVNGESSFAWHVDPIDGTDNFVRKIPFFSISLARLGTISHSCAIVHNPITKQTFSTLQEAVGGLYENTRVHSLNAESLGGRYVISTCCGRGEEWMKPARYALQSALGIKYGKSTSYGSCAMELAYVAANRIDAVVSFGLQSYDYAAGLFLIKAAGGDINYFEDDKWQKWTGSLKDFCSEHNRIFIACHPDLSADLVDVVGNPKDWADRATVAH